MRTKYCVFYNRVKSNLYKLFMRKLTFEGLYAPTEQSVRTCTSTHSAVPSRADVEATGRLRRLLAMTLVVEPVRLVVGVELVLGRVDGSVLWLASCARWCVVVDVYGGVERNRDEVDTQTGANTQQQQRDKHTHSQRQRRRKKCKNVNDN